MQEMSFHSGLKTAAALSLAVGAIFAGASGAASAAGLPDRGSDPIVLKGADAPSLIGLAPSDLVAFSYDGSWSQVPVQVDERKWADYRVIRRFSIGSQQFGSVVYADANTWTEADGIAQKDWNTGQEIPGTTGDPMLDADDEIAMMAKDSGSIAGNVAPPSGVDDATRTPVKISDPLNPGASGYIYLFRTTTGLDPSAGRDYVSYDQQFSPALSSPYKSPGTLTSGYNFNSIGDNVSGPPVNPEASSVVTDNYEQTFPGRWLVDGLKIKEGGASGVDILDGDKSTVNSTGCGRNELTFSRGGGGQIANIDGPVRAIRSYIGANSGTYTQRDQIYWSDRLETNTYLRVHAGITDFVMAVDYSEAASGMTYRNNLNESGVTIDGIPDTVTTGNLDWEQTTGNQGTVTNIGRIVTDVPLRPITSFYLDSTSIGSSSMACSGDTKAIGASGPRIQMITDPPTPGGRNTDPTLPPTAPSTEVNNFTGYRTSFYDPPNEPVATSRLRAQQVDAPLTFVTGALADPDTYVPKAAAKVKPAEPRQAVRPGKVAKIMVTVTNSGNVTLGAGKVCPKLNTKRARTFGCKAIGSLAPGDSAVRTMPVKVKKDKGFKPVKVAFQFRADGDIYRSAVVRIHVRRGSR